MTITEALKRFRKEKGLSQKDIAEVLNTTPQNIYRLEKIDSAISAEAIVKIADAFNVSTDYLLGRSNSPSNDADKEILDAAIEFNQIVNQAINRPSVHTP